MGNLHDVCNDILRLATDIHEEVAIGNTLSVAIDLGAINSRINEALKILGLDVATCEQFKRNIDMVKRGDADLDLPRRD